MISILSYLGKITSPPHGTSLTVFPGSTEKIEWMSNITNVLLWSWYFISSDGLRGYELLADVDDDGVTTIFSSLPEVEIERPTTLVLRNVDMTQT